MGRHRSALHTRRQRSPNVGRNEHLNPGLVDELAIDLAPVAFDGGTPLLSGLDTGRIEIEIEIAEAIRSPLVTDLRYHVHPGN